MEFFEKFLNFVIVLVLLAAFFTPLNFRPFRKKIKENINDFGMLHVTFATSNPFACS